MVLPPRFGICLQLYFNRGRALAQIIFLFTPLYGLNLILDHYLELPLQKSRALGNTKVYNPQSLPQAYEQYRRMLIDRNPKGNREFVKILMLHRDYPPAYVTEALEMAMLYNIYGYDGVLNILGQLFLKSHKVIHLSKEKLQGIPDVQVTPPDLDKYKALMTGGVTECL
jgi:hypothetical protein